MNNMNKKLSVKKNIEKINKDMTYLLDVIGTLTLHIGKIEDRLKELENGKKKTTKTKK